MKSIRGASILLAYGAAAADENPSRSSRSNIPRPIAGLHALQKLAKNDAKYNGKTGRDLQLSDLLGGSLGGELQLECGNTCRDDEECMSFMFGASDPSEVLVDSCNTGCIPKMALSTCERFCHEDDLEEDEDTDAANAIVSVARLGGLFDSMDDIMCSNCKFYKCCVTPDASTSRYDACKDELTDDVESFVSGEWNFEDFDADLTSLIPDWGAEDLPGFGGWDPNNLPDIGLQDLDIDSLVPDGWEEIVEDLPDVVEDVVDAVLNITSSFAPGLSALEQLMDNFDCSNTCDEDLCNVLLAGDGDRSIIEDVCNSNCMPSTLDCEKICENVDGADALGSAGGIACDSCNFVQCCASGDGFDTCEEFLPDMDGLMAGIDWDEIHAAVDWNYTILDWDWGEIETSLGEMTHSIHSMLDQAFADVDIFSVSCNPIDCPVDGACDGTLDLSTVNFDQVCDNAIFRCVEGLQVMCESKCGDGGADNFLSAPLCSLCGIAECCRDDGDSKSLKYCLQGAVLELDNISISVPQDADLEDEDGAGITVAIEDETLMTGPSSGTDLEDASDPNPLESDTLDLMEEPSVDELAESAMTSDVDREEGDGDDPLDFSFARSAEPDPLSATARTSISLCIAWASVAALYFVL